MDVESFFASTDACQGGKEDLSFLQFYQRPARSRRHLHVPSPFLPMQSSFSQHQQLPKHSRLFIEDKIQLLKEMISDPSSQRLPDQGEKLRNRLAHYEDELKQLLNAEQRRNTGNKEPSPLPSELVDVVITERRQTTSIKQASSATWTTTCPPATVSNSSQPRQASVWPKGGPTFEQLAEKHASHQQKATAERHQALLSEGSRMTYRATALERDDQDDVHEEQNEHKPDSDVEDGDDLQPLTTTENANEHDDRLNLQGNPFATEDDLLALDDAALENLLVSGLNKMNVSAPVTEVKERDMRWRPSQPPKLGHVKAISFVELIRLRAQCEKEKQEAKHQAMLQL
eukprot:m.20606 g.20606  ORF g.20606 m.20606 type:complete len:343 (-) comp8924_c0_seq3:173-1201(-)